MRNKNENNDYIYPKIEKDSLIKKIEEEDEIEQFSICHQIYPKGSYIDIKDIQTIKCIKKKPKNKLLSFVGVKNI